MAAKKTFEENMARLEALVAQLERGDAPLSESLALFEEGAKLVSQCRKELDPAGTVRLWRAILRRRNDGWTTKEDMRRTAWRWRHT